MTDPLERIRAIIQEDVGQRGLRTDPESNLIDDLPDDFASACHSIAMKPAALAIVTGFYIPTASPPAGETDGPLGALFLARALVPRGIEVALVTDGFCVPALAAGLEACGLTDRVRLLTLPPPTHPWDAFLAQDWRKEFLGSFPLTHLIALERVGPSHTVGSLRAQGAELATVERFLQEVPAADHDRCHTARGRDLTDAMAPAHLLFEAVPPGVTTIGIGDGGNEIGMGKLPWDLVRRNIPRGGLVACRVPAAFLIVCGVSNWGAYGLAAGVLHLKGHAIDRALFDVERERELLRIMVEAGPLVDGVAGRATVSVDGLSFERYAQPLQAIGAIVCP